MTHSDDQLEEIVALTICEFLVRDDSLAYQEFFEDIFKDEQEKCFINSLIRRTINICDNILWQTSFAFKWFQSLLC